MHMADALVSPAVGGAMLAATAAIAAGVTPFVLSGLIKIVVVVLATVLIRQATQKMRFTV